MKKQALLLFLFVALCAPYKLFAGHLNGNEITYRYIDTLTYEVKYVFYRECSGNTFNNPSSVCYVVCQSSGNKKSLSLTQKSIRELRHACDTIGSQCGSGNQSRGGSGIEAITYLDTVDFRSSKYKGLVSSGCTSIRFETSFCCRGTYNFYNYTTLDLSLKAPNSSPQATFDPLLRMCCNQPVYSSIAVVDTVDFDSISYALVYSQSEHGKTININFPPLFPYYPATLKPPYTNPNANPPIGFTLDPATGDIILTPTKCNEQAFFTYEITEWRKDSAGKAKKISVTRRDANYVINNCQGNNPPIINGKFSTTVCEGSQLCFTITTSDKVRRPPPPATSPPADSVKLYWNGGIPGASFTVLNDSALNQSGRFCWTPPIGSASDNPYRFHVEAIDNNCPVRARTTRAFHVKVNPTVTTKIGFDTLDCGRFALRPDFDSVGVLPPFKYRWVIYDTSGLPILDRRRAYIESTNTYISSSRLDTLNINRTGDYAVELTVDNRPKCAGSHIDTISSGKIFEVILSNQADTFVCQGSSKILKPVVNNAYGNLSYLWSDGTQDSVYSASLPDSVLYKGIRVSVTDTNGCVGTDSIVIFNRPKPYLNITSHDPRLCGGDSIWITKSDSLAWWFNPVAKDTNWVKQGSSLKTEWRFQNVITSKTDSTKVKLPGWNYVRVQDSLGCVQVDSTYIGFNDTAKVVLPNDFAICWNERVRLFDSTGKGLSPTKKQVYLWTDISSGSQIKLGTVDTLDYRIQEDLTLELASLETDSNLSCYAYDTIEIEVNPLPQVKMPSDMYVCFDGGVVNLRLLEDSLAKGGQWTCRNKPSMVKNGLFQTHLAFELSDSTSPVDYDIEYSYNGQNCNRTDSFQISVHPLPVVEVRDIVVCQNLNELDVRTDKVIMKPGGAVLNLGIQSWKCIDCGGYDESKIIVNEGSGEPGAMQFFKLKFDEVNMNLSGKSADTLIIEFVFRNVFGCYNRDTMELVVLKSVGSTQLSEKQICWDINPVAINDVFNPSPTGGNWSIRTGIGYDDTTWLASGFVNDTILPQRTKRPSDGVFYKYRLMYVPSGKACFDTVFTTLKIMGPPAVNGNWTDLINVHGYADPIVFCELDDSIELASKHNTGILTCSDSSLYQNGFIVPQKAESRLVEQLIYSKTNSAGCVGRDTATVTVHSEHYLEFNDFGATWDGNPMTVDLKPDSVNVNQMTYTALEGSVKTNGIQGKFTITPPQKEVSTHRVIVQTEPSSTNVCPLTEKLVTVSIHPSPCMDIKLDYDQTAGKLVVRPDHKDMASWNWTVGTDKSTQESPSFDVTKYGNTTIDIKLIALNKLGDTCVSFNRLDLKTGSVMDISEQFSLFPNPTSGLVRIEADGGHTSFRIQVLDNAGITVLETQGTNVVDCSELADGLYEFRIQTENSTYSARLIKQ